MKRITMNGYTRISKAEARKRFYAGETILICPCKMRPNDKWHGGSFTFDLEQEREQFGITEGEEQGWFDRIVENFATWNCNYKELGTYPAYYKEV